MNQRQVILTVVAVGLVSAALWTWHESSDDADATSAPAQASAPTQATQPPPPSGQVAASDAAAPAPAAQPQPQAESAPAAPDVSQNTVSAPVEPPNVDTPEPAQRKFARGAQPEPDQN
jgi:hypothetical protein